MLKSIEKTLRENPAKQVMKAEVGNIIHYEECIVNAANCTLLGGGGVDGAIHSAAGPELLEECRQLHGCATGEAKITKGYNLKAKYVIHTVGPIYSLFADEKVKERLREFLKSCYENCLKLALQHNIHKIAFPAISTGVYGYPKEEAAQIAVKTVTDFMASHPDFELEVCFVCYNLLDYNYYEDVFVDL